MEIIFFILLFSLLSSKNSEDRQKPRDARIVFYGILFMGGLMLLGEIVDYLSPRQQIMSGPCDGEMTGMFNSTSATEHQYCDPATHVWTRPTPISVQPQNLEDTVQRFCSVGGPGGEVGLQQEVSPGIFTVCR